MLSCKAHSFYNAQYLLCTLEAMFLTRHIAMCRQLYEWGCPDLPANEEDLFMAMAPAS